ncbi:unnamed protein product [Moneuplotes crassus]|uniref:Uncharacterized protein n=1 Tax=Euplotes crassus TaxID=5936 RepID=A0AAD1UGD1_EUPCR|nr:unnamed protein product [Moneuplotes crassus]
MKSGMNFSKSQTNQLDVIDEVDEGLVPSTSNPCSLERRPDSSLGLSRIRSEYRHKDTTKICLNKYRLRLNFKSPFPKNKPILKPEMARTFYCEKKDVLDSPEKSEELSIHKINHNKTINCINYESDNKIKVNVRNSKSKKKISKDSDHKARTLHKSDVPELRFASSQGFNAQSWKEPRFLENHTSSFAGRENENDYKSLKKELNRVKSSSVTSTSKTIKRRNIVLSKPEVIKKSFKKTFGASNGFQILKNMKLNEDLSHVRNHRHKKSLINRRKSDNGSKCQSFEGFDIDSGHYRKKSLASFCIQRSSKSLRKTPSLTFSKGKKIEINTAYGTSFIYNKNSEDNSTAEDEEEARETAISKNTDSLIKIRTDSTGFPCNRKLKKYDELARNLKMS